MPRQVLTAWAVVKEMQAQGIPVHLELGWEGRGSSTFSPRGLVVHHTADGPGEYPSLRIVRDGRSDLPGPLAQWGLGRSGKVYLIAAGRANHAGSGGWRGLSGNTSVWGIEAESTGRGDWTDAQRRNYPRLAAALARHQPFSPDMICAHREWTPRKPDPAGIDMPSFRAEVARLLHGSPTPSPTPPPAPIEEDDDMRISLAPGEEDVFWIEPTTGHSAIGVKRVIVVLTTHGASRVPAHAYFQSEGGPGAIEVTGGRHWAKHLVNRPAGWFHVKNKGTEHLGGRIIEVR